MKVILKVFLDFPQYREIRICSSTAENALRFKSFQNYQKSFMVSVFQLKVISQKFLFSFPSIFFKKIFLAEISWMCTTMSARLMFRIWCLIHKNCFTLSCTCYTTTIWRALWSTDLSASNSGSDIKIWPFWADIDQFEVVKVSHTLILFLSIRV